MTEPLLLTGASVPGFPAGAVFAGFLGPRLDGPAGTAVYATASGGVTPFTDQGIFRLGTSGVTLLVREGDLAPGTLAARFFNLAAGATNPPALGLNTAGELAFGTRLIGGDVCDCNGDGILDNDSAMYRLGAGGLHLLARADGQVPGEVPGLKFDLLVGQPLIAENGTLVSFFVFKGTGVTSSNGVGIMSAAEGGELAMAFREGTPMPGFPAGTIIGTPGRPFVGPADDFSFFAHLKGPGIGLTNDEVLLRLQGGVLQLVAREGDTLANGDVLGNPFVQGAFFNHSLRGGDADAFCSLLAHGGSAVLRDMDGELVEVARSGAQAPGLPAGTTFQKFGDFVSNKPLQLGADGRVVFMARLDALPPATESLWIADPDGTLHLLARSGETPPAAPAGVTFGNGSGGLLPTFGPRALDASGRVAFSAHLTGPGLSFFSRALYATDSSGTLRKVVQPGDQLDVQGDGNELRTVADVAFDNDADTLEGYNGPVFGQGGRLVFRVSFTDGSEGLFASDIDGAFFDLGGGLAGVAGVPQLSGLGTLEPLAPGSLDLAHAAGNAPGLLFIALGSSPLPFKGGVLLAVPPLAQIPLTTSAAGTFALPFVTPSGLPAAIALTLQVALQDGAAVHGVAISTALGATTP
ncbi:MAG TPA: choice-of-anchor tandem repeat NxxGxxAF-containing protein [Planctomycetota bacterium]|nr:choice-of-anchor tandem repeat NxxGxxAF-containing protein [Planctomycetota bacterium]